MPQLNTPDELKAALGTLPGVTVDPGYGSCVSVNGERILCLGQWQDTNRLLINMNGRERMSSFSAVFNRIKNLTK
jgi:hypothetical protein